MTRSSVTLMIFLAICGVHALVPGAIRKPTTFQRSHSSPKSSEANIEARRIRHDWRRKKKAEVIKFAGPALSTVLADPIMSVVDALCVGRFCSTVELASLGPALAVFNFVSYFFFFLNAATCVEVTSSLAARDKERAKNVLSDSILTILFY